MSSSRISKDRKKDYEDTQLLELFREVVPEVIEGIEAPYRLYRYDRGDDRFYYRVVGNEVKPYLSVTSFTSRSLPTSEFLVRWIGDLGNDLSDHKKYVAALYGSIYHIEIAKAVRSMSYDFRTVKSVLKDSVPVHLYHLIPRWEWQLKKDMASFIQFLKDKVVRVIACEIGVYSDEFGLAGTIDLVCEVRFGSKTVYAIVDFKSGKKGFWDSHELQLHSYKELWNERFANLIEVTHVFNFAPNDWQKEPTYKFKNQTNSKFSNSVINRMTIALLEEWVIPPVDYCDISGEVSDLSEFDFNQHLIKDFRVKKALVNH